MLPETLARDVVADPGTGMGADLARFAWELGDRFSRLGPLGERSLPSIVLDIERRFVALDERTGGLQVFDEGLLSSLRGELEFVDGYSDFDFDHTFVIPVDPAEAPAGLTAGSAARQAPASRRLSPVSTRRGASPRPAPTESWRKLDATTLSPYPAAMGRAASMDASLLRFPDAVAKVEGASGSQAVTRLVTASAQPLVDWSPAGGRLPAVSAAYALAARFEEGAAPRAPVQTWLVPTAQLKERGWVIDSPAHTLASQASANARTRLAHTTTSAHAGFAAVEGVLAAPIFARFALTEQAASEETHVEVPTGPERVDSTLSWDSPERVLVQSDSARALFGAQVPPLATAIVRERTVDTVRLAGSAEHVRGTSNSHQAAPLPVFLASAREPWLARARAAVRSERAAGAPTWRSANRQSADEPSLFSAPVESVSLRPAMASFGGASWPVRPTIGLSAGLAVQMPGVGGVPAWRAQTSVGDGAFAAWADSLALAQAVRRTDGGLAQRFETSRAFERTAWGQVAPYSIGTDGERALVVIGERSSTAQHLPSTTHAVAGRQGVAIWQAASATSATRGQRSVSTPVQDRPALLALSTSPVLPAAVGPLARAGRSVETLARAGRSVETLARAGRSVETLARAGRSVETLTRAGRSVETLTRSTDLQVRARAGVPAHGDYAQLSSRALVRGAPVRAGLSADPLLGGRLGAERFLGEGLGAVVRRSGTQVGLTAAPWLVLRNAPADQRAELLDSLLGRLSPAVDSQLAQTSPLLEILRLGFDRAGAAPGTLGLGRRSSGALTNGALTNGANGALTIGARSSGVLTSGALAAGALPIGARSSGALPAGVLAAGPLLSGAQTSSLAARVLASLPSQRAAWADPAALATSSVGSTGRLALELLAQLSGGERRVPFTVAEAERVLLSLPSGAGASGRSSEHASGAPRLGNVSAVSRAGQPRAARSMTVASAPPSRARIAEQAQPQLLGLRAFAGLASTDVRPLVAWALVASTAYGPEVTQALQRTASSDELRLNSVGTLTRPSAPGLDGHGRATPGRPGGLAETLGLLADRLTSVPIAIASRAEASAGGAKSGALAPSSRAEGVLVQGEASTSKVSAPSIGRSMERLARHLEPAQVGSLVKAALAGPLASLALTGRAGDPVAELVSPPAPQPAPSLPGKLFGDRGPQALSAPTAGRVLVETAAARAAAGAVLRSTPGQRPQREAETNEESRHRVAEGQIDENLSPEETELIARLALDKLLRELELEAARIGEDEWD